MACNTSTWKADTGTSPQRVPRQSDYSEKSCIKKQQQQTNRQKHYNENMGSRLPWSLPYCYYLNINLPIYLKEETGPIHIHSVSRSGELEFSQFWKNYVKLFYNQTAVLTEL